MLMKMDGSELFRKRSMWLFDYKDLTTEELRHVKKIEKELYFDVLDRVNRNPRFYLDNLDVLPVFYVSFIDYSDKKKKDL